MIEHIPFKDGVPSGIVKRYDDNGALTETLFHKGDEIQPDNERYQNLLDAYRAEAAERAAHPASAKHIGYIPR